MKRCPKCEGKNLKHCKGTARTCQCNCTKYIDTTPNRVEPEYDSTNDKYYEDFNKRWRDLHAPVEVKTVD